MRRGTACLRKTCSRSGLLPFWGKLPRCTVALWTWRRFPSLVSRDRPNGTHGATYSGGVRHVKRQLNFTHFRVIVYMDRFGWRVPIHSRASVVPTRPWSGKMLARNLSHSRKLSPRIVSTWLWCNKRSRMAMAAIRHDYHERSTTALGLATALAKAGRIKLR